MDQRMSEVSDLARVGSRLGSAAAMTQRSANVSAPLDRPDLAQVNDAGTPSWLPGIRPAALDVVEDWSGEVIQVDQDRGTFLARLVDIRGKQVDRDVVFPLSVARLDAERIKPGIGFRWSLVLKGTGDQDVVGRFRAEPAAPYSEEDVTRAYKEADELIALFEEGG